MPSTAAAPGFDSLAAELMADQDPRVQCKTCQWIANQKTDVRAEWVTVLLDYSYSAASIFRALERRRAGVTRNSVENCRKLDHHGPAINKPDHIVARTKPRS